eukprot:5112488-Prymnesium_polylepis.1
MQLQAVLKWATFPECHAYVQASGTVPPDDLSDATSKRALIELARKHRLSLEPLAKKLGY